MGIHRRGHTRSKTYAHIIELPVERGRPRPDRLPPKEAAIWRQMVDAMPSGYFGEQNAHILRALCSHVVTAELCEKELAAARKSGDLEALNKITAIHARESLTIGNLSSRLKLTPKSRYSQEQASHLQRIAAQSRPWEPK